MRQWLKDYYLIAWANYQCFKGCRHYWCFLDGIAFCKVPYFCKKHDQLLDWLYS